MLVVKSHCFIDGNGRVARYLVNSELECQRHSPVLIPDAMSESMRNALREVYRSRDVAPLIGQIDLARSFTRRFLADLAQAGARDRTG
jgi:hypothetical protein